MKREETDLGQQPPRLAEDRGVPEWLVIIAIVAGLLLTGLGAWVALRVPGDNYETHLGMLVVCCGLAIVLYAFGGRAVGTWGGWTLAGAAAAAPMLFLLQWQLRPKEVQFFRGELQGTGQFSQLTLYGNGGNTMMVMKEKNKEYAFSVFADEINTSSYFGIIVVDPSDDHEKEIKCLNVGLLEKELGQEQRVQWSIRADGNELRLFDEQGGAHGQGPGAICGSPAAEKPVHSVERDVPQSSGRSVRMASVLAEYVIPGALAQDAGKTGQANIPELVSSLNSENIDQRQMARISLAKDTDIVALRIMTGLWDVNRSSYRQDIGLLTAWSDAILYQDRGSAQRLIETLSSEQVRHIVALAGADDQTMRARATQLLALLLQAGGSPVGVEGDAGRAFLSGALTEFQRAQAPGDSKPSSVSYPMMAYNILAALDLDGCQFEPDVRGQIQSVLDAVSSEAAQRLNAGQPGFSDLLSKIKQSLKSCPASLALPAVTLSIFPKKNLTDDDAEKLKSKLPGNYSVQIKSAQFHNADADVLFVDRDWVPISAVIDVLKALTTQGLAIKFIQQLPLRHAEIQVGATVINDQDVHVNRPALDPDELGKLSGSAFWEAVMNGQVWCQDAVGRRAYECRLSAHARPVPIAANQ